MQQEIARGVRDTIGESLARATARNPEKTALAFGDRSWTYAELDAAVELYTASGFVLERRTSQIEVELTGEGRADLRARSRYSSEIDNLVPSLRYLFRTVLPWTVLTFGLAFPVLTWRYAHMTMGGEQYPYITISSNPDGSGVFLEERRKGDSLFGKPMVHPETGETGWSGCPDDYYRNIVEGWKRQLGR